VLGRSFRLATLQALLSEEGVRVDGGVLSRLDDFLEPERDGSLRFRAGLLRKTVYEGLSFRRRLRLHRRAGEVLERLAGDAAAEADALALHFSMAGDHERTWRYARLAADRAARAYANADAAKLYRTALEAARPLPAIGSEELRTVWVARGNVCRLAGLFDEALDAYRQAARLAGDDPVVQADLLRLRALARDRAGAFGPALRELTAGTRILSAIETREARRMRAKLASFAAMIRVGQERYRQALVQGLAAAELALAAGEPEARAQALVAAGTAQMWLGSGGSEWMREALGIYQDIGDLSSEAMVGSNLGAAALIEGRWNDALHWFEVARANELEAGNHVGAACVDSNRAEIYVRQGRLEEAEPLLTDAIRVMRASRFHEGAAYAEIQLGRLLIARGDARGADELLTRVGEEFMRYGRKSSALEASLVRALAKVRLGEASEAMELIDRAVADEDGASGWLVPQAAESRARALAALGLIEEAEEHLAAGLAAAREQGLRYEEGALLRARVELLAAAGRTPEESDVGRSTEILAALGVQSTPGAA
jgi:tetratricopeptide (TPR) repeat protein